MIKLAGRAPCLAHTNAAPTSRSIQQQSYARLRVTVTLSSTPGAGRQQFEASLNLPIRAAAKQHVIHSCRHPRFIHGRRKSRDAPCRAEACSVR